MCFYLNDAKMLNNFQNKRLAKGEALQAGRGDFIPQRFLWSRSFGFQTHPSLYLTVPYVENFVSSFTEAYDNYILKSEKLSKKQTKF